MERRVVILRGRVGAGGKMSKGGQKARTSGYDIIKFWEWNVQHGDCTQQYRSTDVKVAKSRL